MNQQHQPNNGYRVPTLAELYAEDSDAWKNDKFMQLLNSDPPPHWVKVEKNIPYLPIDKVEILLDRIFVGRVQIDVKECKQLVNAIQVTVRLNVFHPVLQQWVYNDGVGAMPIQLQKGANGDLSKVNSSAIQMNAPAAVSFAVKDAAERFGKIFGRDLSRKDTTNYQPAFLSDPFVQGNHTEPVSTGVANLVQGPPPPPPVPNGYQPTPQFVNGNIAEQQQQANAGQTFTPNFNQPIQF